MNFVKDEMDYAIGKLPGGPYIKAPMDFSLDLFEIIQADPATWALELFSLISFTIIPFIMTALMGLMLYDAYMNPAVSALFLKNIMIFRDLVLSKLPSSVTGILPGFINGN